MIKKLYEVKGLYNGHIIARGRVPAWSAREAQAEAFRQLKAEEKKAEEDTYAVLTIAPEALTFNVRLLAVWNESRQSYWRPDGNN